MAENGSGVIEQVKERTGDGMLSTLGGKEFVLPAVIGVAGAVAAAKGPDVIGGGPAGKLLSKALGGSGGKKTRRLPIQRWTDVAVPVAQAYEAWIKFDQYPKFMHRVLSVEREGRDTVRWEEKIWFSRRRWEGRITERRKNDRIAWETTSGMSHKGIVSFHPLGDNLTRVMVEMDFEPNGVIEKLASGLRFVKRAVQSDLARYKAYVEFADARGLEYRSESSSVQARQLRRQQGRAQRRTGSGSRSRSSR